MPTPVYISMTSISSRVAGLTQVFEHLLNQTEAADKIVLNISPDPFMMDEGVLFRSLPEQVRLWADAGRIEVQSCSNTGPYRKLVPTLDRYRGTDFFVVTADDDVLYPVDWLEHLKEHALQRNCITAYRCRLMKRNGERLASYADWPLITSKDDLRRERVDPNEPLLRLLPTGRGGVLYRSSHFADREALDSLMKLAPKVDDIGFRFTTLSAGIPVIWVSPQQTASEWFEFKGIEYQHKISNRHSNDQPINDAIDWCRSHRGLDIDSIVPV